MKKAKCLFSKQDIQTLRETQQKSQQALPLYVTISTKQLQEQLWQTVVYTQGLWVTKHQLLSGDIQFRMNSLLEQYHVYSRWMAKSWWRHQMEKFSALLAICAGNSPVTAEFPAQRPVTRSFDVSLICVWINDWANNREAGDLRRHRADSDVTAMLIGAVWLNTWLQWIWQRQLQEEARNIVWRFGTTYIRGFTVNLLYLEPLSKMFNQLIFCGN